MMVRNLPRMVRYLKDRGTYVLFNTNGTLLNQRNGRALIEAGLDELGVSLHASNAKSFRAIRGKDYFARILRNVRAFRNLQEREGADRPRVSAWLTGLKETIAELPNFVEVAAEIGVREVYLQRLVFFDNDAIGLARPDPALYEQGTREGAAYLQATTALPRPPLCRPRRRVGARHEPQAAGPRIALVALPATLDRDVFHRKRAGTALLHRAVLAARIRKLHLGRCHAADAAGNLERRGLPHVPGGAPVGQAVCQLRQLRPALEPLNDGCGSAKQSRRCGTSCVSKRRGGDSDA